MPTRIPLCATNPPTIDSNSRKNSRPYSSQGRLGGMDGGPISLTLERFLRKFDLAFVALYGTLRFQYLQLSFDGGQNLD